MTEQPTGLFVFIFLIQIWQNHIFRNFQIFLPSADFEPGAKLVPFDSDDTDDEDSPSPSSTLQSQASHSTISSSYGSELKIQSPNLLLYPDTP